MASSATSASVTWETALFLVSGCIFVFRCSKSVAKHSCGENGSFVHSSDFISVRHRQNICKGRCDVPCSLAADAASFTDCARTPVCVLDSLMRNPTATSGAVRLGQYVFEGFEICFCIQHLEVGAGARSLSRRVNGKHRYPEEEQRERA
jgi:hypothetical protein